MATHSHDQMTPCACKTPAIGGIRVLTIFITAPQHVQRMGARALSQSEARPGSNFSSTCSSAIRVLQLGCRKPKGYVSAYDPTTGELVWREIFDGWAQAGTVVTADGLLFVGSGSNTAGYFYAYDAKTGEELWKFNTGAGIFSSPAVYMLNGEEFVIVVSGGGDRGRRGGDLILSFALPKR